MGERRAGGISVRVRTAMKGRTSARMAWYSLDSWRTVASWARRKRPSRRPGRSARVRCRAPRSTRRATSSSASRSRGETFDPSKNGWTLKLRTVLPRDAAVLGDERVGLGILRHRCHRREVVGGDRGVRTESPGSAAGGTLGRCCCFPSPTRGGGLENRNCTGGVSLSDDRGFRRKDADTRAMPLLGHSRTASIRSPDDASARGDRSRRPVGTRLKDPNGQNTAHQSGLKKCPRVDPADRNFFGGDTSQTRRAGAPVSRAPRVADTR